MPAPPLLAFVATAAILEGVPLSPSHDHVSVPPARLVTIQATASPKRWCLLPPLRASMPAAASIHGPALPVFRSCSVAWSVGLARPSFLDGYRTHGGSPTHADAAHHSPAFRLSLLAIVRPRRVRPTGAAHHRCESRSRMAIGGGPAMGMPVVGAPRQPEGI
ncbi:hypothetical protein CAUPRSCDRAFT_10375 [Caulochytrium protostelioides]|uniref:Secreted protein n=1 Tax=Caulochytrium protostelioides TaxID=1555241 RepID=A0A4P9X041_9FUNG|nr:hypothetical protein CAUPRSCDRAFT_10375 [Caulochytrium protostelioides]